MLEVLISIQTGILLAMLSVLIYLATKMAVVNHMTTSIESMVKEMWRKE